MFSPDSLYDYLRYFLSYYKKPPILRTLGNHGSLNLFNTLESSKLDNISPFVSHISNTPSNIPFKFLGYCLAFDQEPIDTFSIMMESSSNKSKLNFLSNITDNTSRNIASDYFEYQNAISDPNEYISKFASSMHIPMVCHSELNSNAINDLSTLNFIPIYYWYHAIISLYWFQSYELLKINYTRTNKKFGLYARDASGTRKYRLSLLSSLHKIKQNVSFNLLEPLASQISDKSIWHDRLLTNSSINSDSSASIEWEDIYNFDIHIIAETLFDTEKIHLTEKCFKPIIMGQPFIMFAGPLSLQYMRKYGFKTFNDIWDESYDSEMDNSIRFNKIINLIYTINNLSSQQYNSIMNKAKKICEYNKIHFYSTSFKNKIINELHESFNNGYFIQDELFYTKPGGTWFSILHDHYTQNIKFPLINIKRNRELVEYTKLHYPTVADQIIKKYNHLL